MGLFKSGGRSEAYHGYYQLRCWVVEDFYEFITEEGYTAVQAGARCLHEYGRQLSGGGPEALTVYSTMLYRVARCGAGMLRHFQAEIEAMNRLWNSAAGQAFSGDALEELTEEVRIINRSLSQPME